MFNPIIQRFQYDQHTVVIETGVIARRATSAVLINMDDTVVLVTVVLDKKFKEEQDFFPLMVNYQERSYSAGKIPGSFFRREGRPNENEILISRLIDRSIRPLFPERFFNEVQVIATVISINPQVSPDIVSIIGASAALSLSEIPFNGPIGVSRVGYIDGNYVLNPSMNDRKKSSLDLIISATSNAVLMVESESNFLDEKLITEAIRFGYEKQQTIIENINILSEKVKKEKWDYVQKPFNQELYDKVNEFFKTKLDVFANLFEKKDYFSQIHLIRENFINSIILNNKSLMFSEIERAFFLFEKSMIRNRILSNKIRIDGRNEDEIRNIDVKVGILPRAHGSALFTRGETQALVSTTLGTDRDAQIIDELTGEYNDRFLFHYNFPLYSVGEIGILSSPKRREVGHGNLAKRSILPAMPNQLEFPYTIRVVSEITESNGSSSMASVCGASLSLMDAGVPIKSSIAGVAIGLIKEKDNFIVLTDISGEEDHFGDMDFKVSGNYDGISALQIDVKICGISFEVVNIALKKAKLARFQILDSMQKVIKQPRKKISKFAPQIYTIKINPEKIKDVIGKGGSVIKALTEETGTIIEINDSGLVKISSVDSLKVREAVRKILDITAEIEVGRFYSGKVVRIVDFGAFVTIDNGKEGLVHISQISKKRVEKVSDYLRLGQQVQVKVLEIDRNGRIRFSIKETILKK